MILWQRPWFLVLCRHFYVCDHNPCFSASVVVSSTMVGKASPMGFVSPPSALCLRPWSLSLCQHFYVFDHGRKGFADVFGSSPNGIMSPTMVFVSLPTFLCLRPWSERLRRCFWLFSQRNYVSDHGLCLSANIFMSSTMARKASPMFLALLPTELCLRLWSLLLRQHQCGFADCLCFIDHGRNACDDRRRVIKYPVKHYFKYSTFIHIPARSRKTESLKETNPV
jgi:hypothetical protein